MFLSDFCSDIDDMYSTTSESNINFNNTLRIKPSRKLSETDSIDSSSDEFSSNGSSSSDEYGSPKRPTYKHNIKIQSVTPLKKTKYHHHTHTHSISTTATSDHNYTTISDQTFIQTTIEDQKFNELLHLFS